MAGLTNKRRLSAVLGMLAVITVAVSGSQALATVPHSSTGTPGETRLTWNATTTIATQWSSSGAIVPITRAGGVSQIALRQPGDPLPAGSWLLTAQVLIANSLEPPTSFRCFMQARGTVTFVGGQLQDWGGAGGWHRTMVIPGLVTMAQPDWIDVLCLHDQHLPNGGVLQIESVDVIAQQIAATF